MVDLDDLDPLVEACERDVVPLTPTSPATFDIPTNTCMTTQDSIINYFLNEANKLAGLSLNSAPIEGIGFSYETPGACCIEVCTGGAVIDYQDPSFDTPELAIARYDLLRDCIQTTPDATAQPFFRLKPEEYEECEGTWTVTADFKNILEPPGVCSSTRDYTFGEDSPYVVNLDCCQWYPDIEPTADRDTPLTQSYLDTCDVRVDQGFTRYIIPSGTTEPVCQQSASTNNYIDRNGFTVLEEEEGDLETVDDDVCCLMYDENEASTLVLRDACEVREAIQF